MTEFFLRACGDDFDVDAFLSVSPLRPDVVWHRGTTKRPCSPSLFENSGVDFVLGDGRAINTCEQEDHAIDYIKAHRDALKSLGKFPGVTCFFLGLSRVMVNRRNLSAFTTSASQILMWHLLDVGCSLTCYSWLEWVDEPEE